MLASEHEDSLALRLESKLSDLRVGYANPCACITRWVDKRTAHQKRTPPQGVMSLAENLHFRKSASIAFYRSNANMG